MITAAYRWLLLALLAIAIPLLILMLTHPAVPRADMAKIYNITPAVDQTVDVRFFRNGECSREEWCRINRTGEYLRAGDWLQTGNVSRVDLVLMYNTVDYRPVLFWQEEGSKSRLESKEGSCHFRIELGKFLYAHSYRSVDKGCQETTSKHALIFPHGSALFTIQGAKDTLVGVLSSPTEPVVVQNSHSGKKTRLRAGQFAKSFGDGSMQQGEFSLAEFYKTQTLGRGLGPESHDTDYVERQEPGIREILGEIRQETLPALREQEFAPKHIGERESGVVKPQPILKPASIELVDKILAGLDWGNIAFNAPSTMTHKQPQVVELVLSPSLSVAQLQEQLDQKADAESARVHISNRMEAQLTGSRGFAIQTLTPPEPRAITSQQTSRWRWEVTPIEHGKQSLHLALLAHIDVAGRDTPLVVQTFDRTIEVEITLFERVSGFIQDNWQWLCATILIPLAPWLWKKWKNRKLPL